ncbi:MAG: hypothetical protein V9G09_13170 [Candidatus Nanopelagicales bacterium]
MFLSKFNRKERFFVAVDAAGGDHEELHAPSLQLTDAFREKLEAAIGIPVPVHAWASIDYHLNWLHAALQWKANPGLLHEKTIRNDRFAADGLELVLRNQEDIDLIVAWTAPCGGLMVVLVEAKAYGRWTNKQVGHKVHTTRGDCRQCEVGRPFLYAIAGLGWPHAAFAETRYCGVAGLGTRQGRSTDVHGTACRRSAAQRPTGRRLGKSL